MAKQNLTHYDVYPEAMYAYMRNYGPHFNRKLFEFAIGNMTVKVNGREQKLSPYSKQDVEEMMQRNGVKLEKNQLYDAAYVANMCKADFYGSSIEDDRHMALYVKDVIDDVDAEDGFVFNRWYADMSYSGIAIDWEEML